MKFRIFLLIFIITLGALTYFGYPIIKNHYFNNEPKIIQNEAPEQKSDNEDANNQIDISPIGEIKSSSIDVTIRPSDCDNECFGFQKNEELEYCKQVCGLSNANQENSEIKIPDNCENVSGLEKNYCLKDLAIQSKDFKACNQINDSGIKKACKNRVTEDIMENQTKSEN
jgi:hypothetical protein